MLQAIDTALAAQAAVTTRIKSNWLAYLRAGLVPAVGATAVFAWLVEAYWATIGLIAAQAAAVVCAAAIWLVLFSLGTGRMIRIGVGAAAAPACVRGLVPDRTDGRILLVTLAMLTLAAASIGLEAGVRGLVGGAFYAPGSDAIARPVMALGDVGVLLGTYYLAGRLALFLPAVATSAPLRPARIWRATDGHGAILFIVALAAPAAVALALGAPALVLIGALPWPGPEAFGRAETLAIDFGAWFWLALPALLVAQLIASTLMAAGLAAAWETLAERGELEALAPA